MLRGETKSHLELLRIRGREDHSASASFSPVRMRTARSSGVTKILPSPIWPVRAAVVIASIALSTRSALDRDFDFQFRQEAHGVFGAAINFRMSLLPSIALDFRHGQAVDADRRQRVTNLIELERLDDRGHDFHLPILCCRPLGRASAAASASRRTRRWYETSTPPGQAAFKCRASRSETRRHPARAGRFFPHPRLRGEGARSANVRLTRMGA